MIWELNRKTAEQKRISSALNATEKCIHRSNQEKIVKSLGENVFAERRGVLWVRHKHGSPVDSGLCLSGIHAAGFDAAGV